MTNLEQKGAEEGDNGDASEGHNVTATMRKLVFHLILSHTHVFAAVLVFSLSDDQSTNNLAMTGLQN